MLSLVRTGRKLSPEGDPQAEKLEEALEKHYQLGWECVAMNEWIAQYSFRAHTVYPRLEYR